MTEIQPMGFKYVYVLQQIEPDYVSIVGIFEASGLAEMARKKLQADLSDSQYDAGIYYRITTFEIGKIYG
jgi:hypothetical protein